ncbi:uncharacterized protein LOC112452271 [Temnothorax curvispinosus]|uniref:Uncharacterized protein LOC112452271 n=1 Tax=Temnothorax curvispinosus TaxID=300111 RepID=A0A6J1PFE4_9HYME|nr:uncharacterized protein LOC112452271 [Temnothorax curvispinosus]
MESEARNQNNDYNKFFYATMCHVCKRFGDDVSLKRCSNCKMISYCGQEHQKEHWKQHKSLCKVIQDVLQDYSMDDRGETIEEWAAKKLTFAKLVSSRLGRRLNADEIQMVCFPRECLVCHERNIKSLESCQKCTAIFCQNHKDGIDHRNICAPLELGLRTDLFFIEKGNKPPDSYLQHVSCTSTFQNIKDFIKTFGNIQTHSEMLYNVLAGKYSEYLTRPLTLFHAMRLLNYVPKSKAIVVHVIGANCVEEDTLMGWEVLPRLIGTAMPVTIIMIGPELTRKLNPLHDSDNFMSRKKKCLTFEFHDVLYENYVNSPSFVKPDLVVGFNLCIHKHELGSSEETWAPSMKLIAKQNCPFVLTSLTLYAFKKETDRINTILDREVDYLYSGKNLFASLRAYRIMGREYVAGFSLTRIPDELSW